jgi:hypothetical protein
MPRLTILIAVILATATVAQATIIHVPADQPTIQTGVNAASTGDTVLVADGTYAGDGNHDIDLGGKAILVARLLVPQRRGQSMHCRGLHGNQ